MVSILPSDNGKKALEVFDQVLPIWRATGDRHGEATTLNNIANVYDYLGEKGKALEYLIQVLPILQALGDRSREGIALNNIGAVYLSLGETLKSIGLFTTRPYRYSESLVTAARKQLRSSTWGRAYHFLKEEQKALGFYNQALLIQLDIKDRRGEAQARNAIGLVYDTIGERQKALEYYNQALILWRAVGDRGGEATTIGNIAGVYFLLGAKDKAAEFLREALPMARAVGDRRTEAITLNNLMWIWKERQSGFSRLLRKTIRQCLSATARQHQRAGKANTEYFSTVRSKGTYRTLANLLISQGRPARSATNPGHA